MTAPFSALLGRAFKLLKEGQPAAADVICQHVLSQAPDNADALYLSGVAAHAAADHARAFEAMDRAIRARPGFADAYCGRGIAERHLGRDQDAIADFRQALSLDPVHVQANFHLGLSLLEQGTLDEAAGQFLRALEHDPNLAVAIANLGLVRHRQGRLDEAVGHYTRAIALQPSLEIAHNDLAAALQELGRAEDALEILRRAQSRVADPMIGANMLTCLNLVPGDPGAALQAARQWAERFAEPLVQTATLRAPDPERRLRVGYVAADGLRRHTLAMTYLPLFEAHDPGQVEVVAYSDLTARNEDDVTRRLKAAVPVWRSTAGLDDAAFADVVRADGIDILVDGIGFAAGSRLLAMARRPAPIQIHFPPMSTTGMTAVDYIVGDARLLPPGTDEFFSERLWRLPCGFLFSPLDDLPDLSPPPALRNGYVTFGSFNRIAKIGSEAIAAWSAVLVAVPDSRLIVKSSAGVSPDAVARLRRLFAESGVAGDRLEFRGRTPDDTEHLRQFNDIDVALDTLPFGGVLTTCTALAMGVPVVTWAGARILERYGAAMLGAIGFEESIASDRESYVRRACALAADRQRLAILKPELRRRLLDSPLCDAPGFARSLEGAYRAMWRERCGTAPTAGGAIA